MIDLFQIAITKSFEWGINKVLDVIWTCSTCSHRKEDGKIANVSHNEIYCPNCHKMLSQFTNACETTVQKDGNIAHVGLAFEGNETIITKWSWNHFRKVPFGLTVPVLSRVKGLAKKQLIATTDLIDFDTGQLISQSRGLYIVQSDDVEMENNFLFPYITTWQEPLLAGHGYIGWRHSAKGAMFAIEPRVETRLQELLVKDRFVVKF